MTPVGTVFAAELQPQDGGTGGYAAQDAKAVACRLRARGVHARPLGNVAYLMVTPTSQRAQCTWLLETLQQCL